MAKNGHLAGLPRDPRGAELPTPATFLAAARNEERFAELVSAVVESTARRHAKSTRRNYDYWEDRLRRWMERPDTRWRLQELPGVPFSTLWPMTADGERIISLWLADITEGPVDGAEREAWLDAGGPPSPNTISSIVAALQARSTDWDQAGWAPSQMMKNFLTGLRRRMREVYGPDRQAEPLLAGHVGMIADSLWAEESPEALRDRVVLELVAAGIGLGGIARTRRSGLLAPRPGVVAEDSRANEDLYRATGEVGLPSLEVPGQARRGNKRDPGVLVCLAEHPALA